MTITYNFEQIKQKAEDVLRQEYGNNLSLTAEEGWHGRVHLKVVSNAFDGKTADQKTEMVWNLLREKLKEEAQAISLVLVYGMDEI